MGRTTPDLVGRSREVAALRARLNAAKRGSGSLVLLSGEPGIGKTRLAIEASYLAERRGFDVTWGRCREGEQAPPYWPWLEVLRSLGDGDEADTTVSSSSSIDQLLRAGGRAAETDRFRLFDRFSTALVDRAGSVPLMVVLEDLHRADEPSVQLLRFVAAEVASSRMIIVATCRDTELDAEHPVSQLLDATATEAWFLLLDVGGLDVRATAELAHVTLGVDAPVDAAALCERTSGNTFFITELLRLAPLQAQPSEPEHGRRQGEAAVPTTVEAAVRARVGNLPSTTQAMLRAASVLGREPEVWLLAALSERPADEVLTALDAAVEARLVVPPRDAGSRYRFVHALVQESLYASLSPSERSTLHGRAYAALHERVGDDASRAPALASHALGAVADLEGRASAYQACLLAADHATDSLAYEDAARWLRAALDVAEVPVDVHTELLLRLGDAEARGGKSAAARDVYERAWRLARQHGWTDRVARAALGVGDVVVSTGSVDHGLVRLLEESLELMGPADEGWRIELSAQLASEWYWGTDLAASRRLAEETILAARRLGDERRLASALSAHQFVLRGPDHLDERVRVGAELASLGARLVDEELELRARLLLFADRVEAADPRLAGMEADLLSALAARTRRPRAAWYALLVEAIRASIAGDLHGALDLSNRMEGLGRRIGIVPAPLFGYSQRLPILRVLGRLEEIEPGLRADIVRMPALSTLRCMLALLLAETDRRQEAEPLVDELMTGGCAAIPKDAVWLGSVAMLADAAVLLGRSDHASNLYDLLAPYGGRVAFHTNYLGAVDGFLGRLAGCLGRWDDAERHLAMALKLHEAWSAGIHVASCLRDRAAVLEARRQPGDAELAEAFRARSAETEARLRLPNQVAGAGRRGAARRAIGTHAATLTSREREVLTLLSRGASNKQIAASLVVSVHTVERHVSNVYAKTGTRNRAEATAWALTNLPDGEARA